MTQQYTPNLGETPGADARRDAVHIAVAPVVAGQRFEPGWGVRLGDDGRAYTSLLEFAIGIVDPFLKKNVLKGERFWLFLKPNTVTSLRHVWSHPAFVAKIPPRSADDVSI